MGSINNNGRLYWINKCCRKKKKIGPSNKIKINRQFFKIDLFKGYLILGKFSSLRPYPN
jgi:hypothetical protein